MEIGLDFVTLLTGLLVFSARILDVSLGTIRTISIVNGRTKTAFLLGFFEVSIWLLVISAVVPRILEKPILAVFYALGFSTGNVVGIKLEHWLALGHIVLRIITPHGGRRMAERLREAGLAVTTFQGEGLSGPVTELYVACRRRDVGRILQIAKGIEPDFFYVTEPTGAVSRVYRPTMTQFTGWRAVFKRK